MELYYLIQLDNGNRYTVCGTDDLSLKINDWVVVRKDFYQDYGQIIREWKEFNDEEGRKDAPKVVRKATVHDKSIANENLMRGKSALRTSEKAVERLNLPMNLLNTHYSFDGKLVVVQFTADGRVDFRELVKELAQLLNTRIELRQIGVRDETAICGGIGICGQQLCCSRFLTEFASINVRMAKDQDLSLTPGTISGSCGRLKCCLKYEHDGYVEMERDMPRRGEHCQCDDGSTGRIIDRNLLTRKLTVQLESGKNVICAVDDVKLQGRKGQGQGQKQQDRKKENDTAANTSVNDTDTDISLLKELED
jgi:cell fate regulator YaaT (PSP1 superfamily)